MFCYQFRFELRRLLFKVFLQFFLINFLSWFFIRSLLFLIVDLFRSFAHFRFEHTSLRCFFLLVMFHNFVILLLLEINLRLKEFTLSSSWLCLLMRLDLFKFSLFGLSSLIDELLSLLLPCLLILNESFENWVNRLRKTIHLSVFKEFEQVMWVCHQL